MKNNSSSHSLEEGKHRRELRQNIVGKTSWIWFNSFGNAAWCHPVVLPIMQVRISWYCSVTRTASFYCLSLEIITTEHETVATRRSFQSWKILSLQPTVLRFGVNKPFRHINLIRQLDFPDHISLSHQLIKHMPTNAAPLHCFMCANMSWQGKLRSDNLCLFTAVLCLKWTRNTEFSAARCGGCFRLLWCHVIFPVKPVHSNYNSTQSEWIRVSKHPAQMTPLLCSHRHTVMSSPEATTAVRGSSLTAAVNYHPAVAAALLRCGALPCINSFPSSLSRHHKMKTLHAAPEPPFTVFATACWDPACSIVLPQWAVVGLWQTISAGSLQTGWSCSL